jgi:hypothetical protein
MPDVHLPMLQTFSEGGESPAALTNADTLYQYVFSSPTDFLTTLRDALQKDSSASLYGFSPVDLAYLAKANTNPKEKAAELTAAAHYDQIEKLSDIDEGDADNSNYGLTVDKLTEDINLISGNTKSIKADQVQKYESSALGDLALAGAAAAAAFAGVEVPIVPPIALGVGGLALFGAGVGEIAALSIKGDVLAKAFNDKQFLASLPEIGK